MMYSWRVAFGAQHLETGGHAWAHQIVRAPTAADALTLFETNCQMYRIAPRPSYFRGPEHIECFEPKGSFGVWDKHGATFQNGGWVRDAVTGDILSGDYRWAENYIEELASTGIHGSTAQWAVREFRDES